MRRSKVGNATGNFQEEQGRFPPLESNRRPALPGPSPGFVLAATAENV